MDTSIDIFAHINQLYDKMSSTQKRIADYFLNFAEQACFMSLKETAEVVKVTEATILRFCSKLGYTGYLEFKNHLSLRLRKNLSNFDIRKEKIALSSSKLDISEENVKKIVDHELSAIQGTLSSVSIDNLLKFTNSIKKATRIHIACHNLSEVVGSFLRLRLLQLGYDVNLVDFRNTILTESYVLASKETDCFIFIAFPKYSPPSISLAAHLTKCGRDVLAITDSLDSPIAQCSTASLICDSSHPIFYNSLTAALAMCNLMLSLLVIDDIEHYINYQSRRKQLSDLNFQYSGTVDLGDEIKK